MAFIVKTAFSLLLRSLFLIFIFSANSFAQEITTPKDLKIKLKPTNSTYNINFNNVAMVEYVRFVSKICNLNFIFDETELNFKVTIVAKEPTTQSSIISTLIQTLRIHGLMLLEENNNLVIHKSEDVKQVAKIISEEMIPLTNAPIATCVFTIYHANVANIATILRSMISKEAILETSPETKQIIITDITSNIKKISELIEKIEAPDAKVQTQVYQVKNNTPTYLVNLAEKVLAPIISGATFIMVPQEESGSIFITSSPPFIEKALATLQKLDVQAKAIPSSSKNIFIYKIINQPFEKIEKSLQLIAQNLLSSGYGEQGLVTTLKTAKFIKESNSILFTGNKEIFSFIKDFLTSIDVPEKAVPSQTSFYIYKIKNIDAQKLISTLKETMMSLSDSKAPEQELIQTLNNIKYLKETNSLLFIGSNNTLKKIEGLLPSFDVKSKFAVSSQFLLYTPKYVDGKELFDHLLNIFQSLEESNADPSFLKTVASMKWIETSNLLLFTGDEASLKQIDLLLQKTDVKKAQITPSQTDFALYEPKYVTKSQLEKYLKDIAFNLSDKTIKEKRLKETISKMKWLEDSNSFMFSGDKESIEKIKSIIKDYDIAKDKEFAQKQENFFIYELKYVTKEQLEKYLKDIASNLNTKTLKECNLKDSISNMKWLMDSNSFMFSGDDQSIASIKEIIASFDLPATQKKSKASYFLYKLKNLPGAVIKEDLNNFAQNIKENKMGKQKLLDVINNIKWIKETNSLLITGDEESIEEVKKLISEYDVKRAAIKQENFFIYELKYVNKEQFENYLKNIAQNLSANTAKEKNLKEAISNMKWMPETNSFMFTGDEAALLYIKEVSAKFDVPSAQKKISKQTYFLYKLKHAQGPLIEEDLDNFAQNIKDKKLGKQRLLDVIDNIKWVKETNSLLITGDEESIEEVKKLISEYDVPREKITAARQDNFFLYKPLNISNDQFEQGVRDVTDNLEKSKLADPNLIESLKSLKYVESSHSFIFTGTKEALTKVKELITSIDLSTELKKPTGASSFLLYKLKKASPQQIKNHISAVVFDLKKSASADKNFIDALNTVKYIKESNSLLFTGFESALVKVQKMVESFDNATIVTEEKIASQAPGSFFIYKPLYVSGPTLEIVLQEFLNHLQSTGLDNQDLFNTINSMKWVDKTNSLIFTGTAKSLEEVKTILGTFDIPGRKELTSAQAPIQPIDNTSFLIYKLQYHKGDEIQTALKQIAKSMAQPNSKVEPSLLSAIDSTQWIEITNSLICSGQQETIEKMKELIKNLDIPLKQVFIEVLVIQTQLSNLLNFGLEWGIKGKYRQKVSLSTSNFPPGVSSSTAGFPTGLNSVNATTTPNPNTQIPFEQGFDLGVIGDIILHKGKSFLSLGSLLNAIQTDSETTIVMTPKIIAQDGKTSKIFSGKNIPYVGSYVQNASQNTLQTYNLEYRDIGMDLTITPVLGNADVITLTIALEQSSETAASPLTPANVNVTGITTAKTTMSTTVHIPNKKFLVLSGMVTEEKIKAKAGIPCLGGLPLIGAAFSKNSNSEGRDNIVIFIRPHIINSYKDMNSIAENQEEYFRESTGSPLLEQEYDEGIERLKSYEEEDTEEEATAE